MARAVGGAAAAAVLVMVLAGCDADGAGASGASGRSVEATATGETVNQGTVRSDVEAAVAAGGLGRMKFTGRELVGHSAECNVIGALHTDGAPDLGRVRDAVAELKKRRWKQTGKAGDDSGEGWLFKKGSWQLDLLAGATSGDEPSTDPMLPQTGTETEPFSGVTVYAIRYKCAQSAAPTPTDGS
ncbi:hypothetical protein OHS59_29085 [Streptomyces sp. NBC_00414]|uniref:hypothetical protein n=1 Tax=Streptomyces sp. NBC_00414 TaxID=2975739 RepID=UPI002E214443